MDDISKTAEGHNSQEEFNFERSTCILPARTSVLAYLDDNGELWIYASDAALQCDTELRIAAEDLFAFIDGLTELVGIPAVGRPQPCGKPPEAVNRAVEPPGASNEAEPSLASPLSNAEKCRAYRER